MLKVNYLNAKQLKNGLNFLNGSNGEYVNPISLRV